MIAVNWSSCYVVLLRINHIAINSRIEHEDDRGSFREAQRRRRWRFIGNWWEPRDTPKRPRGDFWGRRKKLVRDVRRHKDLHAGNRLRCVTNPGLELVRQLGYNVRQFNQLKE